MAEQMIGYLYKLTSLLLAKKTVENVDIAASYDKVSNKYEQYFLNIMHRHNDKVLDLLVDGIRKKQVEEGSPSLRILDLACGTGYNSRYLQGKGIDGKYTLVDLSKGMIRTGKEYARDGKNMTFVNQDMLSFLNSCPKDSYDIIICMWAIKYQPPKEVIQECERVIKKGGWMGSIVNSADTLPQMRALYPKLLISNWRRLNKVMFDLPNPKNKQVFAQWFRKAGFSVNKVASGRQTIHFQSTDKLVEFLTSTGALAGYDNMLDLRNPEIKLQMSSYFNRNNILKVEHRYVYGLFKKGD